MRSSLAWGRKRVFRRASAVYVELSRKASLVYRYVTKFLKLDNRLNLTENTPTSAVTSGRIPDAFDVVVVGAGHAGAEAAHAAAKGGLKTLLITMNLDTIGQMSCNPAIGGIAKGHMVREVDALGGIMGRVTDKTGIHFKMLNRSKGPAVWAPRAQAEKRAYQNQVKWTLEHTPNLSFRQDTVEGLIVENHTVKGVITGRGHHIQCRYVVLTTGTFLQGLIHVGEYQTRAGRFAEHAAMGLSDCLRTYGFALGRLKTGTPPRVLLRSLDLSVMQVQEPDDPPQPFSFSTEKLENKQIDCYITYTNANTHKHILDNLHRAPMYSGQIQGTGPRYCPSIEDKVVRFADKERHHIFVEPEGVETGEVYLNGVSTSLPEDVQWDLVRSCAGMEQAEIIRPGYAVEYDYVDPRELGHDLQTKKIKHLYFAGQINGTTGYEEAAAQGMMAGLNILRASRGEESLILGRGEAYIGVLVDDLVLKGVEDPYRMFTSRAEHRLILRQDNADERLMKYGRELGLVSDDDFKRMQDRYERVSHVKRRFHATGLKPGPLLDAVLERRGIPMPDSGFGKSVAAFLRRPEIQIEDCIGMVEELETLSDQTRAILELELKYEGYVRREHEKIRQRERFRLMRIPKEFDYDSVTGLKYEARDKLKRIQPEDLDTASRISGVDPPDVDLLYAAIRSGKTDSVLE
ncbi:MAG: tRNA uridine-5-carboxymethylaminomethyl(34) synthesis enzyme MnmG [Spirochaetia bacterium]|nr:tRNA uridine-5-carboxymethylaminomethyl(34) synthesis enzyme MnmG [Spirochaetia bacterium]